MTYSEELERRYHLLRDKLGLEMHRFVKTEEEAEEREIARMRRRFHIHVCLLGVSAVLTYLSIVGVVSIIVVTGTSTSLLIAQEYIDRIGRF